MRILQSSPEMYLQRLEGHVDFFRRRLFAPGQRGVAKPAGLAFLLCCLCIFFLRAWSAEGSLPNQGTAREVSSSYLHLLVPASEGNANLCKTIFSAAALDYPTPQIVNWQRKFDDPNLIFGGSHIAKIEGILNFLRGLTPESDEDLALIIDGYDIWFQLRPSVLIERYHAINRRANDRIRARLGPEASEMENVAQSVIFSSQKRCWPSAEDDFACYAVPLSDLPKDVYGPETDTDIGDDKNPYVKFRQRFLNSGTVIGPVAKLRAVFERALEKSKVNSNIGSDQGVFAEIFGEQEYQREVIRQRHLPQTLPSRLSRFISNIFRQPDHRDGILDPAHHRQMEASDGILYEFGIGLDYRSEISQPTVFSEDDLAWTIQTSPNYHGVVHEMSQAAETTPQHHPPRQPSGIPSDIHRSTPPFWAPDHAQTRAHELPAEQTWDEVPLYTNLWTDIAPAAIHHNAHRDGLKSRIQTLWNQTWYFPHLRALLAASARSPRTPCAVVQQPPAPGLSPSSSSPHALAHSYWSPIDERGCVKTDADLLRWGDVALCGDAAIADEVFRDGGGAWRDQVVTLDWNKTVADGQLERWRADVRGSASGSV